MVAVEPSNPKVDTDKIEKAIREILIAIGENPEREGLIDTPRRVAKFYQEFIQKSEPYCTIFSNVEHYDEMVVIKDINFYSLCEHHLIPFFGKVHVAYIPQEKFLGLSKIVRIVNCAAGKLQIQERMTQEIRDYIENVLHPVGVGVVVEAEHLCMAMRGVRKPGHKTITSALGGAIMNESETRNEFMKFINGG